MKSAVIIITYNNEKEISDAIESVKCQTFTEWQCVIVDNGSTDNTFDLAKACISGDSRFSAIKKENEGPSAGRNFGFRQIEKDTRYIHFLDGDDMIYPDFLSEMISYLDEHSAVGLLGCQYDEVNEAGVFLHKGYRSRFHSGFLGFPQKVRKSTYATPFESFFSATGQGAFAVFRVRDLNRTSGFDAHFWTHEDSDIFCQMALISEVHYLPQRLYKVRIRPHSLSHSKKDPGNAFRDKWDLYASDIPEKNELIESALRYYYTRHKPLRDFKVALKAFRKFSKTLDWRQIIWAKECFVSGMADLISHRNFKKRMSERRKKSLQSQQPVTN